MYSYHIFYFPFKWMVKGREKKLFAEQTDLDNIVWNLGHCWKNNLNVKDPVELQDLYSEKNYFYEFVHSVLYDTGEENSILKHFERIEPQEREVSYIISKRNDKTYTLKVDAINLNLYETGVGMLSFFLKNERHDQKDKDDILKINQYGRRVFPPFYKDIEEKIETAEYISIEGLTGSPDRYKEDFKSWIKDGKLDKKPWTPACFINNLILDLSDSFEITPVIDDRMFVNCWYGNDDLVKEFKSCDKEGLDTFFKENDFWYKFIHVDMSKMTCQNDELRLNILNKLTYKRWQKEGQLYGVSRSSFVFLSGEGDFHKNILAVYMRTMYSRIVELILFQRASVLRFSDEVTHVGQLSKVKSVDKHLISRISSIYKEYIRFTNQIYFTEVTAQDQGIELYNLISETLNIQKYIDGLNKELNELYQFVSLVDDRIRNKNAEKLNILAAIFFPAALITGLFGMNTWDELKINMFSQSVIIIIISTVMFGLIQLINKRK